MAKKLCAHGNTVYEWENERIGSSRKSMERLARFLEISKGILKDFEMGREKVF